MQKKLISITAEHANWLQDRAESLGVSDSEVIRRILDASIQKTSELRQAPGWYVVMSRNCTETGQTESVLLDVRFWDGGEFPRYAVSGPFPDQAKAVFELNRSTFIDLTEPLNNYCEDSDV